MRYFIDIFGRSLRSLIILMISFYIAIDITLDSNLAYRPVDIGVIAS
jgi:hypothetical protein